MATPDPNSPSGSRTGRSSMNDSVKSAAANLAGPALDLAQGATAFQAATNALKGAALDKLLGPTALFAGGLIGVLRTMKAIVDQSGILERGLKRIASIQQIQGKFETLLKSAEKAQQRLKELYKFTASSPFDFSDVAEANRILEALTKGALSGSRGMKLVGDSAAATGTSMTEAAERVGKLYNALRSGRSLDRIMFQLQATGAVTDELARQLEGLEQSGAGFTQMWAAVEQHLARTEGGMKNEMQTIDALGKRILAASAMMEQAFAAPFIEAQAKAMENTLKATQNLTPVIAQIGQDMAPILKFFQNIKNEFVTATLATRGFGEAMQYAWIGAKSLFVALTAGAVTAFLSNIVGAYRGVVTFTSSLSAAYTAAKATTTAVAGLAAAQTLGANASKAYASGNLLSAASLKAQSLWAGISTRAIALHQAAMAVATASAGGFSLATYASSIATGALSGALTVLRRVLVAVTTGAMRAFIAAFVTNPIVGFVAALTAGGVALLSFAAKTKKAHEEFTAFLNDLSKMGKEVAGQVRAVRTLDEWRDALAKVNAQISETVVKMKELDTNDPLFGEKLSALRTRGQTLTNNRAFLLRMDPQRLGLSRDERQRILDSADEVAGIREARRQASMDRGDMLNRRDLLQQQIGQLTGDIARGRANRAGRDAPERFRNNPTELMRVTRQIEYLEKNRKAVDPRLYARQAELLRLANSVGDNEQRKISAETELASLQEQIRLKELELLLDAQIAQERAKGAETSRLEAEKELRLLQEQLRIAQEKGKAGEFEARIIASQIEILEANRAKFRADAAGDRMRNQALEAGDTRRAQAIDDVRERQRLRDQYRANGMSEAQADADYALRIRAQAMQNGPRVVADSMQSIGGGGGFGASNPMVAAQQRIAAMNSLMVTYLKVIADNSRGGIQ